MKLLPGAVALTLSLLLAGTAGGCGDDGQPTPGGGGLDGPVMYQRERDSDEGEAALIEGRLEHEGDCLYVRFVSEPTLRYPVLWPHGTTWRPDPESVVLPDGTVVEVGGWFSSGGGYHDVGRLSDWMTDWPAVVARAEACAEGEFREIAVIQSSSPCRVLSLTSPSGGGLAGCPFETSQFQIATT